MKYIWIVCAVLFSVTAQAETRVPSSQFEINLSFAPLVKQTAPAVVNIYAKRIVQGRSSPFELDPFFRDFFRGFDQPRPRVQNSLGSGVILSPNGIVVSNYHVVGQASEIRVVLNDGQEFEASVVLSDEESDLAILQITPDRELPFLALRDSDSVEVGELVLAIGNPFGVGQTVSSGIVSGLARSGAAAGNARGYFIQTDAPINPGNSGGALVDVQGRLIGVNTSILSRSGGSNGIGFAIPASLVAQFVRQAEQGFAAFKAPWAGLASQAVTSEMADSLGLDVYGGAIVTELHPDSPFGEAGLEIGDVIITIDGHRIGTPSEALYRLKLAGIGSRIEVGYVSKGDVQRALVELIEAPTGSGPVVLEADSLLPALTLQHVSPRLIDDLGLPLMSEGIVVIDPTALGERIGLRRGDLIVDVNGQAVETAKDVDRLLRLTRRNGQIVVIRGGRQILLRFRT